MVDLCTHERKKDVRRRRGPKIFAPAPLDRCYDLVSKINNFTSHLRNTECYNPECPCRPQRNQYCPDSQDPVHNRGFYSECHLHKSPYTCPTLTTWSTWPELDRKLNIKSWRGGHQIMLLDAWCMQFSKDKHTLEQQRRVLSDCSKSHTDN